MTQATEPLPTLFQPPVSFILKFNLFETWIASIVSSLRDVLRWEGYFGLNSVLK